MSQSQTVSYTVKKGNGDLKEETPSGLKPEDFLQYFLTFVITILVFTVVLPINIVPSGSMEPTIKSGTIAFSWKLPYFLWNPSPGRGDIVIFKDPDMTSRFFIKRVIGIPGDEISFEHGKVYLNGNELEEKYLKKQNATVSPETKFTVPDGYMFVMGDNRENSNDSRFLKNHFIAISSITAKYLFGMHVPILQKFAAY